VKKHFVLASFDINCSWAEIPPVYRVYVNDELFTEREWRWHDHYLTETLQILATTGLYKIVVEPINNKNFQMNTSNYKIEVGPARWNNNELEILDES
jgi:hypothetical protein